MAKSKKGLQVSVAVPDDQHMKHIVNAYGLVCQYRTANKVPHESLDSWLLRLVIEGCNALYNYHNQQLAEQKSKTEGTEEVAKDDGESKTV